MTHTERRQYILAATCKLCRSGYPTDGGNGHHAPWEAVTSRLPCTANHALADEVEKWITETIKLAAHTGGGYRDARGHR